MKQRSSIFETDGHQLELLSKGRWANADLFSFSAQGTKWVVKDFSGCPPLVSGTWGRWMIMREYRALVRLQGIDGIPEKPFLRDGQTLGYQYVNGTTLRHVRTEAIPSNFFPDLEHLVRRMHQRKMVHLDIRNRRNIMLRSDGKPALLDFQSSLDVRHMPPALGRMLKQIDLSGVYKIWYKLRPDLMDASRLARLQAIERRRFIWVFKGYPLEHMKKRRR
ncbi:MAG: hypothetical protein K9K81_03250 [Desulfobacteraceae bacterium]|nr:hypothetical protein [Desulfobacteraceae bacterium]